MYFIEFNKRKEIVIGSGFTEINMPNIFRSIRFNPIVLKIHIDRQIKDNDEFHEIFEKFNSEIFHR